MLNKVFLHGRLTADPELHHTNTGTPVVSFTVAVDRDFKSSDTGERGCDFLDVVAWRSTAEFVCKYFAKGRAILVEGSLQTRNWTAKDGSKRHAVEVVANQVWFGESKRQDEQTPYSQPASQYGGQRPSQDSWQPASKGYSGGGYSGGKNYGYQGGYGSYTPQQGGQDYQTQGYQGAQSYQTPPAQGYQTPPVQPYQGAQTAEQVPDYEALADGDAELPF